MSEIDLPKANYAPGSMGFHEVLHASSIVCRMIDEEICDHPAIQQNPELAAKAQVLMDAAYRFYCELGGAHL